MCICMYYMYTSYTVPVQYCTWVLVPGIYGTVLYIPFLTVYTDLHPLIYLTPPTWWWYRTYRSAIVVLPRVRVSIGVSIYTN